MDTLKEAQSIEYCLERLLPILAYPMSFCVRDAVKLLPMIRRYALKRSPPLTPDQEI